MISLAKNVSSASSLMTTCVTLPPSDEITEPSRSWVSGRDTGTFCIGMAMASASKWPIQIGRYRWRGLLLEHDHALVVRHVHADALDEDLDHGALLGEA